MTLAILIPILIVIAIFVSLLGSISGVGGGVLFVPILMLVLNNLEIESIKFISTTLVFVGALINVIIEIVRKRLNYIIVLIGTIVSIPSIIFGRYLNDLINSNINQIIIIIILSIVSVALIYTEYFLKKKEKIRLDNKIKKFYIIKTIDNTQINIFYIVVISFIGGLITSLTGMGGGPLLMPLLIITCNLTMKEAAPISHSLIMVSSLISLIFGWQQFEKIDILIKEVLPMLIGVVIGVCAAIWLKPKIRKEIYIKWILIILIWLSIIKIILDLTNIL